MMMSNTKPFNEPGYLLMNIVEKAKRQTVAAACEACRRKKTKCDGNRPCSSCSSREIRCKFLANENESQRQAVKRKHEELSHSHEELSHSHNDLIGLYNLIATTSEHNVSGIVQRVRNQETAASILAFINHGDLDDHTQLTSEERARCRLLVNLMQSTTSLKNAVAFAAPLIDNGQNRKLPSAEAYQLLRHRIIHFENLRQLLQDHSAMSHADNIADGIADGTGPSVRSQQGFETTPSTQWLPPPFCVPASPWTRLTNDDEKVSQLVSLFLTLLNGHFRWVEQDLFLEGMQSGQLESVYCSPFLVNSICAFASQHSEWELSFSKNDDLLTRGEHFNKEAQRLWDLEEGRVSMTSIQALQILSIDTSIRGNDKTGFEYSTMALQMHKDLRSFQHLPANIGSMSPRFARANACLDWSVAYWHLCVMVALVHRDNSHVLDLDSLPPIDGYLSDALIPWTGYPLSQEVKHYPKDLQLAEICKLIQTMREAFSLIFSDGQNMDGRSFHIAVENIVAKLCDWHEALPPMLAQIEGAPAPVYEMMGHYHSIIIVLYIKVRSLILADSQREAIAIRAVADRLEHTGEDYAFETLIKAVSHAQACAAILRYHRETYGVKIIPPALFQTCIISSLTLLQAMQARQAAAGDEACRLDDLQLQDSFLECFRFLLASGLQHMVTRGVTRMLYHTSRHLNVALPPLALQMLSIAEQSAWSPSNLEQISSDHANFAVGERSGQTMEGLLGQWEDLGTSDPEASER